MENTDPITDEQGRPEPPLAAGELTTLTGFLDFLRATVLWKTQDVTDDGLQGTLPGHPSGMTLGGLLKHLAYVEDYWFSTVLEQSTVEPWASVDWGADEDWDWHSAADDSGAELRELWGAAVRRSRVVVSHHGHDLDRTHLAWGGRAEVSTRWVLTHMIEEYARHTGHADLLREAVDGQVGE